MANRERGEVSADFNGRTFTFVLDTEAMEAIEELLSTPEREVTWDQFWPRCVAGSVRATTVLIWAMLQRYHPDLKNLDDARAVINDAGGPLVFVHVIKAAATASTPDVRDLKALGVTGKAGGKKANPPQAQETDGATSSPRRAASA